MLNTYIQDLLLYNAVTRIALQISSMSHNARMNTRGYKNEQFGLCKRNFTSYVTLQSGWFDTRWYIILYIWFIYVTRKCVSSVPLMPQYRDRQSTVVNAKFIINLDF